MRQSENIICFSSIDWDFIWQGQQQIMLNLSQQGHRVLYIENTGIRRARINDLPRMSKRLKDWYKGTYGFRKISENLYVYSPIILPFPYSKIILLLNSYIFWGQLRRWLKSMNFHHPMIWSFLPTSLIQNMISKIDHKLTIYYYTDNLSQSSKLAKKITPHEIRMIKKADIVFAHSHDGIKHCSHYNQNSHYFPYGVDLKNFCNLNISKRPVELQPLLGPIIGYVGGIHKWIDFNLIYQMASTNSHWNFVFIGPIQHDVTELKKLKNVLFTGQKPRELLPHYIFYFDVCLIPYQMNFYTDSVCPSKLNEYLIMGKKVISTSIKEIEYFNQKHQNPIAIANSPGDFIKKVKESLEHKDISEQKRFIKIAQSNSWENHIVNMMEMINKKTQELDAYNEKNWSYRFRKYYAAYPKKVALFLSISLMMYYFLFFTSLPWRIAQPLNIVSPLKKSDAVLALGGGVGESGEAGQGYQERVTTAVRLYNAGYASHIIFSSGYNYLLKEALTMKNLAVSLGVPKENIVIEDKSANTYENLKNSSDLIKKYHYKSLIIVSSPYHLRRVSLVAKKQLPKEVTFLTYPVVRSLFFNSFQYKPTWPQLNAIIHEYLAIIYYKFKHYT